MLANREGLRRGGTITLPAETGPRRFRVVAVAGATFDHDNGLADFVVASEGTARRYWHAGVDFALVRPSPGTPPAVLAARLERSSGVVGLQATDRSGTHAVAARNGGRFLQPVERIGYVMLVVAALGIVNFFLISLAGRHRLVGMLRMVGYDAAVERRTLVAEAATTGLLGAFLGTAGAAVFTYFVSLASPALLASQVAWGVVPRCRGRGRHGRLRRVRVRRRRATRPHPRHRTGPVRPRRPGGRMTLVLDHAPTWAVRLDRVCRGIVAAVAACGHDGRLFPGVRPGLVRGVPRQGLGRVPLAGARLSSDGC